MKSFKPGKTTDQNFWTRRKLCFPFFTISFLIVLSHFLSGLEILTLSLPDAKSGYSFHYKFFTHEQTGRY